MFTRTWQILVNRGAIATAALVSLAYPTGAYAQLRVEIAPAGGAYQPGGKLPSFLFECGYFGGHQCEPDPSYRQLSGAALGGRVSASIRSHGSIPASFAIEGAFWYVLSHVVDTTRYPDGHTGADLSGSIDIANLHAMVSLPLKSSIVSGLLMGGPALIHRSGSYFNGLKGTTSIAGTLGAGLEIHPGHRFSLRAEVMKYLYKVHFFTDPLNFTSQESQHDMIVSLSLSRNLTGPR
jgi:hypothetical protein